MKQLRMYLAWPIIFVSCWYFFSLTVATIAGLLYLHVMIIILINLLDKHKEKLIQIVEHIAKKDGSVNSSEIGFSNIKTANDVLGILTKIKN